MRPVSILFCCALLIGCDSGDSAPRDGKTGQGDTKSKRSDRRQGRPPRPPVVIPAKVALSADGKLLLLGYRTVRLKQFRDYLSLWDVNSGKRLRTLKGPKYGVSFVAFLPRGKQALAGSDDGHLYLFDVPGGKLVRTIKAYPKGGPRATLSPDGQFALTLGRDGPNRTNRKLKLWKLSTGQLVRAMDPGKDMIFSMAISPDNRLALYGGWATFEGGNWARLWDLTTGKPVHLFPKKEGWGGPVAFSPDNHWALLGKRVKRGGNEIQLVLWDLAQAKEVVKLEAEWAALAFFLPSGGQILARSSDDMVTFWDVVAGRVVRSVRTDPGQRIVTKKDDKGKPMTAVVRAFAISRDGTRAAAVTGENNDDVMGLRVKVWDLTTGKLFRSWADPAGERPRPRR